MRPIREPNYSVTGKPTDYTNSFIALCNDAISHLQSAISLSDRDCPYDAESALYAAHRSFREATELITYCSNNYELTAQSRASDKKPSDSSLRCSILSPNPLTHTE